MGAPVATVAAHPILPGGATLLIFLLRIVAVPAIVVAIPLIARIRVGHARLIA